MNFKQGLGLIACLAVPAAAYASGCSSGTTTNADDGGTTSSGSGSSGGGSSSGGFSSSTSGSSSGGSGSGSGSSSGSTSGSSSGTPSSGDGGTPSGGDGGDGGGACTPPTTVTTPPAYQAVTQVKNACTSMQITQYLAACLGPSATTQTCTAFVNASSANLTCYQCISPQSDAGTQLATGGYVPIPGTTYVTANTPGCIAILDPTNGPACAQAYEPLVMCELEACTSGTCPTDQTCQPRARAGACSTEFADAQTKCAADLTDGGAGAPCLNYTDTQILNVICGTGM